MSLRHKFPRAGYVSAEDDSGHKIYYEEYGPKDAPAFVMIHGNVGAMFDMDKLSMWDMDRHHVVIIHARGIGNSQPAAALHNNQYPNLADDTETVRKHLDLGDISLFGWSGGTAVSLLYAEKFPQHCERLLLYGTYLGTKQDILDYYDGLEKIYPERWKDFCDHYGTRDIEKLLKACHDDILSGNLDAVIRYKLIFEPLSTSADDILAQQTPQEWQKTLGYRQVHWNMLQNLFGMKPDQIETDIGKIRDIPVFFINGEKDHITPPNAALRLASCLPKSRLLTVPQADHDIHAPNVQAFFKAFLENDLPVIAPKPVRTTELVMKNLADLRDRASKVYDFDPDAAISANAANPTTRKLEEKLAEMEGGRHALATGTGQAAIVTALLGCLHQGDHLLLPDTVYGPIRTFADRHLKALGIETSYYHPTNTDDLAQKITPKTKMIYLESPGSLTFEVQDIGKIAALAQNRGILTAIDNTWATPLGCSPLAKGVDIVLHSLSKTASGEADVFAGALVVNDKALYRKLKDMALFLGHWLSPDDAARVIKGLDSLPDRLQSQQASAQKVLDWLKKCSWVKEVFSPTDPANENHAAWKKDYSAAGSLLSFSLGPDVPEKALAAFLDHMKVLKLSFGWGGPGSLIVPVHPARTTQQAPQNLIRLYVGREPAEDIIGDLSQAFDRLESALSPQRSAKKRLRQPKP